MAWTHAFEQTLPSRYQYFTVIFLRYLTKYPQVYIIRKGPPTAVMVGQKMDQTAAIVHDTPIRQHVLLQQLYTRRTANKKKMERGAQVK